AARALSAAVREGALQCRATVAPSGAPRVGVQGFLLFACPLVSTHDRSWWQTSLLPLQIDLRGLLEILVVSVGVARVERAVRDVDGRIRAPGRQSDDEQHAQ